MMKEKPEGRLKSEKLLIPYGVSSFFVEKYAKMRDNTAQQRLAGGRFAFIAAYFPADI